MAKVDSNPMVPLHGKIRDLVYVRLADGRIIVRAAPIRRAPPTAPEKANQRRFRLAAAYVKSIRNQADLFGPYENAAKVQRRRASGLAVADFLHPPELRDVDLSGLTGETGQRVLIRAWDDFEVVSVEVCIRDLNGTLLEQGPALSECNPTWNWVYTTTRSVPDGTIVTLEVRAKDRPGHEAVKVLEHVFRLHPSL